MSLFFLNWLKSKKGKIFVKLEGSRVMLTFEEWLKLTVEERNKKYKGFVG